MVFVTGGMCVSVASTLALLDADAVRKIVLLYNHYFNKTVTFCFLVSIVNFL